MDEHRSWHSRGEWTPERKFLLTWILKQPEPGEYGIALLRLQRGMEPIDLPKVLLDIETQVLKNALLASQGNIAAAARLVGLNRTTCSARLRALGLIYDEHYPNRNRLPSVRIVSSREVETADA